MFPNKNKKFPDMPKFRGELPPDPLQGLMQVMFDLSPDAVDGE